MARVKTFDENEVLGKAIELFWVKGYYATSINDLVENLGLSRSSLYDTFGDKHELFERAFEFYQKQNTESLQTYLNEQISVRAGLKAMFTKAIDQALADRDHKGCLMVNTTTEMVPGDDRIRQKLIENREILEGIFEDFIVRGISSGELSDTIDASTIASLLFTLYNGLNVTGKINPDRQTMLKSMETVLTILD